MDSLREAKRFTRENSIEKAGHFWTPQGLFLRKPADLLCLGMGAKKFAFPAISVAKQPSPCKGLSGPSGDLPDCSPDFFGDFSGPGTGGPRRHFRGFFGISDLKGQNPCKGWAGSQNFWVPNTPPSHRKGRREDCFLMKFDPIQRRIWAGGGAAACKIRWVMICSWWMCHHHGGTTLRAYSEITKGELWIWLH